MKKIMSLAVLAVLAFSQVGCGYFTSEADPSAEAWMSDEDPVHIMAKENLSSIADMISSVSEELYTELAQIEEGTPSVDVDATDTTKFFRQITDTVYDDCSTYRLIDFDEEVWAAVLKPTYTEILCQWDKYPEEYLSSEFKSLVYDILENYPTQSNTIKVNAELTWIYHNVTDIFDNMIKPSIVNFKTNQK